MSEIATAASRIRNALSIAGRGLVEREPLVELIALAAVAGEHLLVVGPPGTAKSEAVRRVSHALGGSYFEYLLGRFTEPSELFGPVDLSQLRKGLVETRTEGMLPEAELAFLDEVFLGSTAILNTLLGLLNERKFRRGHTVMDCPLRVCVAASNSVPDEPALAAFADRFVLRMYVGPIGESRLEELLDGGWNLGAVPNAQANMGDIDVLRAAARAADVAPVRPVLAHAIRLLRSQGIPLSDRRVVKAQKLAASAAVLSGRTVPTAADIWPLVYAVPTAEDQSLARDTLRELLEQAENSALPHAAAQASLGPAARAALLAKRGETVLATPDEDVATWRLKLQALLREIDAGFDPNARPEAVAQLRTQLADALGDV